MRRETEKPRVTVPCEPTRKQLLAGMRVLDLWADDALAEEIDGYEMAGKVYEAMTSEDGPGWPTSDDPEEER